MSEQEPRRVTPEYSVIFIDPSDFPEAMIRDGLLASYTHKHLIPYKDSQAGFPRVAVVGSNDPILINDIANIVRFNGMEVLRESVQERIKQYSTRLPNARASAGVVVCEEPSCSFHLSGGCVNPDVVIEDSCAEDSWCMTYKPKEGSTE